MILHRRRMGKRIESSLGFVAHVGSEFIIDNEMHTYPSWAQPQPMALTVGSRLGDRGEGGMSVIDRNCLANQPGQQERVRLSPTVGDSERDAGFTVPGAIERALGQRMPRRALR